jgi:hypothetical protein
MGFRGVWLTPGVAVNRRFGVGKRHDLQKGPPNSTPSAAFWTPVDWQLWAEDRPLRKPPSSNSIT